MWWEVLADEEGGFCFQGYFESDFQLRFRSRRSTLLSPSAVDYTSAVDSFYFLVYFVLRCKSRFRSRRGASYFVLSDKVSKTLFYSLRAERTHNHRQSFVLSFLSYYFCSPFVANFGRCLSVIMRFLLSASRVLFSAHLCLKLLFSIVTATFCYCHALYISHCLPLPFAPYSLP